jgi:methionyl-tRNA formyltransferase
MRTLFFGNHTVGVIALEALIAETDVQGVVAHPPDPEDGVRYRSVYDHARQCGLPVIRGEARTQDVQTFVMDRDIDLLWVTDYRYILPPTILTQARLGGVNLHPSLLPRYRGRASLNWAIINGESTVGLTAHFLATGIDSGDIIKQVAVPVAEDEYINDVLNRLFPLYESLTREVLQDFRNTRVTRSPQEHLLASTFPARRPTDGQIDWCRPATDVKNHVRAISHPYPGAFSSTPKYNLRIWKADTLLDDNPDVPPGTILAVDISTVTIKCGYASLLAQAFDIVGSSPQIGDILE